jgi:exonuclease SbcD
VGVRAMRIGITADLHLTAREDHPERYNSLENILSRLGTEGSQTLVIAGDLFDKDFRNYSEFERLIKNFPQIQIHIIPGNHDANISERGIVAPNIHIYTMPKAVELGSITFVFVPYKVETNMGDVIAALAESIRDKEWVLVGHGDYYGGVRERNPLEPGTYMPLSRENVELFRPRRVFLGHIHKYCDQDNVCYPGSPCGLDITETGKRRFLLYDTNDGSVKSLWISTDIIYFNETFIVVPLDDEVPLLQEEIRKRIESWNLDPSEKTKAVVRARTIGYATDRQAIFSALKEGFAKFKLFNNQEPSIEQLSISTDRQLNTIAECTIKLIDELDWDFGGEEPERQAVKLAALKLIYGE